MLIVYNCDIPKEKCIKNKKKAQNITKVNIVRGNELK